ncbi:MAG TPA: carboxypeptidase-like regulatory domain-containing protein [Terriglobales bacterium]|nr:carboxypeptidase-like regulatory domain-containing protein [Terriglobales bacterium]
MRFSYQLLLIFVLSATLPTLAQEKSPFFADEARGMIAGTVLDANGQVAEGARVCLSVSYGDRNSGITTESSCPISADKYGQFQFEHLKIGSYTVFAGDAADQSGVDAQQGPKVTLTADTPYAHVTLHLKPGGILLGSVSDASSGKPVRQFQVQYVELDRQGGGSSFGQHGKFRVVVPVASDLVVIVTAQGYKGWVYTDSDDQSHPVLRVAAGEQKQLDIELQPLSPGAVPGSASSPSSSH